MSDTVDIEKIVKYIKESGGGMSQLALSKKLKVSRYQIKKAIKFILGVEAEEVEPEDDGKVQETDELTVTSTGNDCVSLTPKKTTPCSVGDVFVNSKGVELTIILVDIEESFVWWASGLGSPDGHGISCSKFKNWKRLKGIKFSNLNLLVIHAYARFIEANLSDEGWVDSFRGNDPLPAYQEDYNLTVESNRVSRDDEKEQVNVTDEIILSGGAELTTSKDLVNPDSVKKSPFKLIISSRSVTLIDGDESLVVTKDNAVGYTAAIDAINSCDWPKLKEICSGRKAVAGNYKSLLEPFGFNIVEGFVVMNDATGSFRLGGLEVLTNRLTYYSNKGDTDSINNVGLFINKLLDNPDQRVMNRIVEFIKFADIEIDSDGDLLVYKYVNGNFKDSYTGRLDNSPGSVVKMKRVLIDPSKESLCSQGLHVCSASYVFRTKGNNNRLVLCKLNPRDIVSIPTDYNGAKIRACEYKVLKDITSSFVTGKIKVDHKGVYMK